MSISRQAYEYAKSGHVRTHQLCVISQVFSAFCIEACINHVGDSIFKNEDWEKDSKGRWLSFEDKLKKLADHFKVKIEMGKPPFQLINEIFNYRNRIAHGRTWEESNTVNMIIEPDVWVDLSHAEWRKLSSIENAEKYYKAAKAICEEILKFSRIPEYEWWDAEPVNFLTIEKEAQKPEEQ